MGIFWFEIPFFKICKEIMNSNCKKMNFVWCKSEKKHPDAILSHLEVKGWSSE